MIDRPCRPLFPEGFYNDTQIIGVLLSTDTENDPDMLAINGASAALSVSDIPWHGPIAAVRVARVAGELVINPTHTQRKESDLDLVYVGNEKDLVMIEGAGQEISEADMMKAVEFAHSHAQKIAAAIRQLAQKVGKPKRQVKLYTVRAEAMTAARDLIGGQILSAILTPGKLARHAAEHVLKDKLVEGLKQKFADITPFELNEAFHKIQSEAIRNSIVNDNKRPDGRGSRDLRPLFCEVGLLPRTHGSAIFQRGETQALVITTLGSKSDTQDMDAWTGGPTEKKFILHYNFPPFSVGETGRTSGPGRREIGHGALAERSVQPMIPDEVDFPYTIRVTSEIMESNGSTSMASVCGATLSLLDAGVPMKAPVAGISIGLVVDEKTGKSAMLTDILGSEDHFGDMDFKVAGTRAGITALQMDIKVPNVTAAIMHEALEQAHRGRLFIIGKMEEAIQQPRANMSEYAPRIYTIHIPTDKIRDVIGPGGKVIRGIIEQTGVKIDVDDDGTVHVSSADEAAANKALQIIGDITAVAEVGKTYLGKVVRLVDFGAFVEIFPGTDGLLHISEIAENRVREVRDELKEGDQILVKVLALEGNKIKLSRKAVLREQREKLAKTK